MKRMACAMALLLTALVFAAGETDDPAHTPGRWREWVPDSALRRGRLNPRRPNTTQINDIYERLGDMADIFRATPTLSSPLGFEIKGSRSVDLTLPRWANGIPAGTEMELNLFLYPYYRSGGRIRVSDVDYTGHIMIYGNDPIPAFLMGPGVDSLEGEPWFLEPLREDTVGRFPLYRAEADARTRYTGPHRFVVIPGPGCPPLWVPVSTEEYISDLIRRQEAVLAEQRRRTSELPSGEEFRDEMIRGIQESIRQQIELFPEKREELLAQEAELLRAFRDESGDMEEYDQMREGAAEYHAEMETSISDLKARLAAMTRAERNSQARAALNFRLAATPGSTYMVPPGTPGSTEPRGVVRVNPALFDRNGRATAARFLIISLYAGSPDMRTRMDAITRELDWEALAGLVE
ncbi:MAG: hypothetical protein ACOC0E_09175 [Spirochaetota bacterium]